MEAVSQATAEDASLLEALHATTLPPGWSAPEFAAYCGKVNRAVLKATSGVDCTGLLVLQFAAGEAEVLTLAVQSDRRRRGIASLLMNAAIAACRTELVSKLYLEVAEGNVSARNLYHKCGFRAFGRRERYYHWPVREAAIIMRLELGGATRQVDRGAGSI